MLTISNFCYTKTKLCSIQIPIIPKRITACAGQQQRNKFYCRSYLKRTNIKIHKWICDISVCRVVFRVLNIVYCFKQLDNGRAADVKWSKLNLVGSDLNKYELNFPLKY